MKKENGKVRNLSTRQKQILDFIKNEIKEQGYPPTIREIAEGIGLSSTGNVHEHLRVMEEKGVILRDPGKFRSITVL